MTRPLHLLTGFLKYSSGLPGRRPQYEISAKHQRAIRSDIENQLPGVEHSSAHQRALERDQWGADYHPGLPLMKASAPWRLTNGMRERRSERNWKETDTSRCAKCANQSSGETNAKLQKSRLAGPLPRLQTQRCCLTVTGTFINILT